MNRSFWLWYPGDFELYHAMKQNFSRMERGIRWPAFWKSEGFRNRVVFRRTYHLEKPTNFTVYSDAAGFVLAGDKKYPFGKNIVCSAGEISISIHAACIERFPSIYIEGTVIRSDAGWMAEDYDKPPIPAGCSKYYTEPGQRPSEWVYDERIYEPVRTREVNGGVLVEFETELTAQIEVLRAGAVTAAQNRPAPDSEAAQNGPSKVDSEAPLWVFCGESREEALDMEHCYYGWQLDAAGRTPRCAVRYGFIPDCRKDDITVRAIHQYVDIPVKASFSCDDELLNRIWEVAAHTFRLCSGIFFIDGIKRDKWIWGGDAYQSLFVNQYLFADEDIDRRTLLALRGNDPMTTHINTIVDYSLFWILSVKAHYEAYADVEFLRQVYPKMVSLMEFCEGQLDEHGFLVGREQDWIYIDWAEFDKEGPLCAEQMLLAACYQAMAELSDVAGAAQSGGAESSLAAAASRSKYADLVEKIDLFYWDEEQSAYIDSFVSGRRHVTRHANIFAVLYGIADEARQERLVKSVLFNSRIPAITTPYFKFYELDVLCRMGYLEEVLAQIKSYWGGMLEKGAVTFWEEYDPEAPDEEQYDMYGDRFGKSLCHAWAASPVYLLAKYFAGLEILSPGGEKYKAEPKGKFFRYLDCTLPVGSKKSVHIHLEGKERTVIEK